MAHLCEPVCPNLIGLFIYHLHFCLSIHALCNHCTQVTQCRFRVIEVSQEDLPEAHNGYLPRQLFDSEPQVILARV